MLWDILCVQKAEDECVSSAIPTRDCCAGKCTHLALAHKLCTVSVHTLKHMLELLSTYPKLACAAIFVTFLLLSEPVRKAQVHLYNVWSCSGMQCRQALSSLRRAKTDLFEVFPGVKHSAHSLRLMWDCQTKEWYPSASLTRTSAGRGKLTFNKHC